MTKKIAEKIVKGITDKIECNTVDIDDWAEFWGFTREEYEEFLDMAVKALEQHPCYNPDEWCKTCKEYNHDKHCCPRYNKVIRNSVEEMKQQKTGHWIPVKFRPLTDEEQEEYPDYCYMADCPMPDEGEEILVSTKYGRVEKDECGFDDGYYLDSGCDWQTDIVAWMPLPKSYEPQESEVSDADRG